MDVAAVQSKLEQSVFGQPQAIKPLVKTLKRYTAGLHRGNRPVGAFMFAGPSGCGKTHTCLTLAQALGYKLVRIDCSEYMQEHETAKLLGSPAGYVRSDEVPMLTRQIDGTKGLFVLLLDEVEKAHPRFFDLFLQILDHGHLTDSKGTELDFTKSIVIFTTNLGSKGYTADQSIGLVKHDSTKTIEAGTDRIIRQTLRIEFINRLDAIIKFKPLSQADYERIITGMVDEVNDLVAERGVAIEVGQDLVAYITRLSNSKEFGARETKRVFRTCVEDLLADQLCDGTIPNSSKLLVHMNGDSVALKRIGTCPLLHNIVRSKRNTATKVK